MAIDNFKFAIALLLLTLITPRTFADERPNILLAFAPDWSYPHAGAYRDPVVRTPTFDRVATRGVLFMNGFAAAPLPERSRETILGTPRFVPRLEQAGYAVGSGPFDPFFRGRDKARPFCFVFESSVTRRPYVKDSGVASGKLVQDAGAPFFLPDLPDVRSDMLDYYTAVEKFDRELAAVIDAIDAADELENTIVVVTATSGFAFPRAKGNLYDYGVHVPLAIMWQAKMEAGRTVSDFVSLRELPATFLAAAGLGGPGGMLPLLVSDEAGRIDPARDHVVIARDDPFRGRAVRTDEWLYIVNDYPDRWPAGEPGALGAVEDSPTKRFMIETRGRRPKLYDLAFSKRPAEELYSVLHDRDHLNNVADDPEYADVKKRLRGLLEEQNRAPRERGG